MSRGVGFDSNNKQKQCKFTQLDSAAPTLLTIGCGIVTIWLAAKEKSDKINVNKCNAVSVETTAIPDYLTVLDPSQSKHVSNKKAVSVETTANIIGKSEKNTKKSCTETSATDSFDDLSSLDLESKYFDTCAITGTKYLKSAMNSKSNILHPFKGYMNDISMEYATQVAKYHLNWIFGNVISANHNQDGNCQSEQQTNIHIFDELNVCNYFDYLESFELIETELEEKESEILNKMDHDHEIEVKLKFNLDYDTYASSNNRELFKSELCGQCANLLNIDASDIVVDNIREGSILCRIKAKVYRIIEKCVGVTMSDGEIPQLPGVRVRSGINVTYRGQPYQCKVTNIVHDENPLKNSITVEYLGKPFRFLNSEVLYIGLTADYRRISLGNARGRNPN